MTPVMMASIAFCATLLPYMGDGPRWPETLARYSDPCKANWWTNALYIHNLVNVNQMVSNEIFGPDLIFSNEFSSFD